MRVDALGVEFECLQIRLERLLLLTGLILEIPEIQMKHGALRLDAQGFLQRVLGFFDLL